MIAAFKRIRSISLSSQFDVTSSCRRSSAWRPPPASRYLRAASFRVAIRGFGWLCKLIFHLICWALTWMNSEFALRPTNCHATIPQPVHAVSTLSVFGEGRGSHVRLEENDQLLGVNVHGGYAQSKWVADRMLIKVWWARRAIACSILFV